MSSPILARRTAVEIAFAGTDITSSIRPYLLSVTYTDNEDKPDDLQIQIQDRDSIWMQAWLNEAIEAASAAKLAMDAVIVRENWLGGGGDVVLPCGVFELDSVAASGPPAAITIRGTSLPFSAQVRQTLKNNAWENYSLSGIANEIAAANGMTCMYESANDPFYSRVEQTKTSDIVFLNRLCDDAGISLKVTNHILVFYDQAEYEAKEEGIIPANDKNYQKNLSSSVYPPPEAGDTTKERSVLANFKAREYISYLTTKYEDLTGITARPASPEMLFIRWVADIIIHERVLTNYAGNQNIPSRAERENLDALAELFRLQKRPGAQPAECVVRFSISEPQKSAILIPTGTRVADRERTLYWETIEDAYVEIGAGFVDVRVRCQTPGIAGNGWKIGQLNSLVDVYDYYADCANITASDGGFGQREHCQRGVRG